MRQQRPNPYRVAAFAVLFVLMCLFLAATAEGQSDPCQPEVDVARQVCRAKGKKSQACARAKQELKFCRLESGGNDPLEGLL